jgi:deoxycytidylate deaminase
MMPKIVYPYLPFGREILYVPKDNVCMFIAELLSASFGCVKQPTGAVIVISDELLGGGSNAGKKAEECPRWGSPTGENYGPCKTVCGQESHAEIAALRDALGKNRSVGGADLYLYGHWWCCKDCWDKMIAAGIRRVYLLEKSWEIFNPEINKEMKNWGNPKNM